MRRFYVVAVIAALTAGASGCTRPSEADCKKAITNIRKLHGNETGDQAGFQAAVRSCQGSATRDSVKCFINADSLEALKKCEGDLYEKMFGKDEAPAPAAPPPAPAAPPPAPAPTPDAAAAAPADPEPGDPTPAVPPEPGTAAPAPEPDTAVPAPE